MTRGAIMKAETVIQHIGVQDFLGSVVPGGVGVGLLTYVLKDSKVVRNLAQFDGAVQWGLFLIASLAAGLLINSARYPLDKLYNVTYAKYRRSGGDDQLNMCGRTRQLTGCPRAKVRTSGLRPRLRARMPARA